MSSRRLFLMQSGRFAAALLTSAAFAASPGIFSPQAVANARSLASPDIPPLLALLQPKLPAPEEVPLEVKIGQMVMVGFAGKVLTEKSGIIRDIQEKHLGGVVLFRPNIESPVQLKTLTGTLQAAASIPLLISTDQEGGYVSRLPNYFGLVSNYSSTYLGARDVETTRYQADTTAQVLREMGINLNLAPVVDLAVNPANRVIVGNQRSFSADPAIVVALARTMIEAHHQHNVLCTLKHFPGHGSSLGDTHAGFVDVTSTWREVELQPFAELSKQQVADVIMTAHIYNANLDPQLPSTLSYKVITGILRERLGYGGVVMSDDMQMKAIASRYSAEDAVRMAIEAGVDVLAISNNLASKKLYGSNAVGIILNLVADGKITTERIDQSFRRILALKRRLVGQ